jgi:uncharacterized Tic20 family protein
MDPVLCVYMEGKFKATQMKNTRYTTTTCLTSGVSALLLLLAVYLSRQFPVLDSTVSWTALGVLLSSFVLFMHELSVLISIHTKQSAGKQLIPVFDELIRRRLALKH